MISLEIFGCTMLLCNYTVASGFTFEVHGVFDRKNLMLCYTLNDYKLLSSPKICKTFHFAGLQLMNIITNQVHREFVVDVCIKDRRWG